MYAVCTALRTFYTRLTAGGTWVHFRRQLVAPGELGLVKVWGPYLSLLHANLWSRLPATAAPAFAFPQTRPYLFTAIRARFSPPSPPS